MGSFDVRIGGQEVVAVVRVGVEEAVMKFERRSDLLSRAKAVACSRA
jgi:hypothetical protein